MNNVTERWRTERVMAAFYDTGVKHDRVAMVGTWAMWGADMRLMFADVARLADVPAGTSVLDIPCGVGFARTQDAIEFFEARLPFKEGKY
jgi:hypothetical protein